MSDERSGAGRARLERLAAQARREAPPEPDVTAAVRSRLATLGPAAPRLAADLWRLSPAFAGACALVALVSGWIGYDAWLTLASPMADLLGYGSWLM